MDFNEFRTFSAQNKDKHNKTLEDINAKIDGRICMNDYLYNVLSMKEFLGKKCKVYLETGTLWGGSLISLMNIEKSSTLFIGVDLFTGYYEKNVKKNDWNKCSQDINSSNHLQFVENNIQRLNLYKNQFKLIKGSSYSNSTIDKVKQITKTIDLCFIDGDHSERGVTQDFLKYKDFMSSGGIMIFDNYGEPNTWEGVKKGVDKIDFIKYGFRILGQLGYSFYIEKL